MALASVACAPAAPPPARAPAVKLHLAPACELVPAARLTWVVDAKPRAIAQIPELIPAIATVVPEERFARFASGNGVDARQVEDLCVGRYRDGATLFVARGLFDTTKASRAFEASLDAPATRAIVVPNPEVLRLTGASEGKARARTLFGREVVAEAEGKPELVRVAEAFAEEKLHRASPALRAEAVARAASLVGDAPLRVFAPGPFEGEEAKGLAGLLQVTTAIGLSARWVGPASQVAVHLVLVGAFPDDTRPAATERLVAEAEVVTHSSLGRLLAFDRTVAATTRDDFPDAIGLTMTFDAAEIARGVHDALEADVAEIMRDRRPLTPKP